MAASFSQIAGAVHVDKLEKGAEGSSGGAGGQSSKDKDKGKDKRIDAQGGLDDRPATGSLKVLGGVTAKWVVTPSHMIGNTKKPSSEVEGVTSNNNDNDFDNDRVKEETVESMDVEAVDLS